MQFAGAARQAYGTQRRGKSGTLAAISLFYSRQSDYQSRTSEEEDMK
jgi:hypothetical protein